MVTGSPGGLLQVNLLECTEPGFLVWCGCPLGPFRDLVNPPCRPSKIAYWHCMPILFLGLKGEINESNFGLKI